MISGMFGNASRISIAFTLASSLLATGCLSSTYRIPHDELQQLTQVAPAERGKHVRVVQNVGGGDDPPSGGRVESNTTVIIVADTGPHYSAGGGGHGNGARPGGGHGTSGKLAADDSKAWIVLAAVVAVALAATEGARYDGWVSMHPMMPVHLYGPNGEYMVVPLAQLTPELAAWADRAVVRETEGPWAEEGRAPLNRVGFTYSVLFGTAQLPSADESKDGAGFQSHIQFGFFPAQQFGLQLDFALGFRDLKDMNGDKVTLFDGRYSLEADVYPVAVGPLHAGLFGQIGLAQRIEDGGPVNGKPRDKNGKLFGGGAQAQLDLTTRLALTARVGYVNVMGEPAFEGGLGLSIY
jgi:hypothetical protein